MMGCQCRIADWRGERGKGERARRLGGEADGAGEKTERGAAEGEDGRTLPAGSMMLCLVCTRAPVQRGVVSGHAATDAQMPPAAARVGGVLRAGGEERRGPLSSLVLCQKQKNQIVLGVKGVSKRVRRVMRVGSDIKSRFGSSVRDGGGRLWGGFGGYWGRLAED